MNSQILLTNLVITHGGIKQVAQEAEVHTSGTHAKGAKSTIRIGSTEHEADR